MPTVLDTGPSPYRLHADPSPYRLGRRDALRAGPVRSPTKVLGQPHACDAIAHALIALTPPPLLTPSSNNCIRKISPNASPNASHLVLPSVGVCDDKVFGYAGDGGLASEARLNITGSAFLPAVDLWGSVYVPDRNNHVIRKVSMPSGIISTVAGTAGMKGTQPANNIATPNNPTHTPHIPHLISSCLAAQWLSSGH